MLLPKLQDYLDEIKEITLVQFRKLMIKIHTFMKCNSDVIVSPEEERKVFNCKTNAMKLRSVKKISKDTEYELDKMLSELKN